MFMNMHRTARLRVSAVVALGLAMVAVLLVSSQVFGGTYLNTIEPGATLDGRHLEATIIIGCDAGQQLSLRVTASQRNVGAVAEGRAQTTCTGDEQHIPVALVVHGRNQFVPTEAAGDGQVLEVCALAVTSERGHADDSHQWCKAGVELLSTS